MDIIFATNDNFSQHAAVAIASLLDNNKNEHITIHLFEIQCKESNINKIKEVARNWNAQIKIYNITPQIFKGFPPTGSYSIACYLRLLSPSLLPNLEKVLYLDCDIIVNGSIKELWCLDISNYSMAALPDATLSYKIVKEYIGYNYYKEGYINSGVLLINLKYWREHNIQEKLVEFLNTHYVKLPDQDALNIILHGTIKFIHPKWNCHVGYFSYPPLVIKEQKKYIKELWSKAVIIHFTGPTKPWYKECVNPYKKVYLNYLRYTPYKDNSQKRLENNYINSVKVIILRYIKNIIAKFISFTYK